MRLSDDTKISLLLIVIAIAALLCVKPARSEPHGDMPSAGRSKKRPRRQRS